MSYPTNGTSMTVEEDAYAYLRITGLGSVDLISQQMGREPDDGWSEGDPRRLAKGYFYKFSKWQLNSGVSKGFPLDTHLRSLWRRLEPHRERLIRLDPEFSRRLVCVAWFKERDSYFSIAAGHFKTASYFQLELDFDFYFRDDFGHPDSENPYYVW